MQKKHIFVFLRKRFIIVSLCNVFFFWVSIVRSNHSNDLKTSFYLYYCQPKITEEIVSTSCMSKRTKEVINFLTPEYSLHECSIPYKRHICTRKRISNAFKTDVPNAFLLPINSSIAFSLYGWPKIPGILSWESPFIFHYKIWNSASDKDSNPPSAVPWEDLFPKALQFEEYYNNQEGIILDGEKNMEGSNDEFLDASMGNLFDEFNKKLEDLNKQEGIDKKLLHSKEKDKFSEQGLKNFRYFEAKLASEEYSCCTCGVNLQKEDFFSPGYVPQNIYKETFHSVDSKRSCTTSNNTVDEDRSNNITDSIMEMIPYDIVSSAHKNKPSTHYPGIRCARCCSILSKDLVPPYLRPGDQKGSKLISQYFKDLISKLRNKRCIILYMLDIHDFKLIPDFATLAGSNPVFVGVNKVDLLPKNISQQRIINWVYSRLQKYQISQLKPKNIFLLSTLKNMGLKAFFSTLLNEAKRHQRDIYMAGMANAGKSSFINYILSLNSNTSPNICRKSKEKVLVSFLPGTTLNFLKVDCLGENISIYDSPGLILPGSMHDFLTQQEVKSVIPKKYIKKLNISLLPGKCVLVGGMVKIELIEGNRCFITPYVSAEVKIHHCQSRVSEKILREHTGILVYPPKVYRDVEALKPFVTYDFEILGKNINKAAADIYISGLGWFAINTSSPCTVRVYIPDKVFIEARRPLLPFEKIYF